MSLRIPLYPGTPAWAPSDAVGLRLFLSQPLGQILLSRLMFARPQVSALEGEQRRIQQDERSGFESCIAELLSLAEPEPLTDNDRSAQTTH